MLKDETEKTQVYKKRKKNQVDPSESPKPRLISKLETLDRA
jgi:hypothetical protein